MSRSGQIGSVLLLTAVVGTGLGLAARKYSALRNAVLADATQPEPMETVTVAMAREHEHQRTTTAIGTVIALRSVTLRNELPGTVHEVSLVPGQVVEAGTVLVALDVSVEEAELKAQEAQAALAQTLLGRMESATERRAASAAELDRARAEHDVALAQITRTRALIARKTIRAPFRARVGLADVHPGQYLGEGTFLTTLQGVDDAVHVDFPVPQRVAARLSENDPVEVFDGSSTVATIVAVDSRIDVTTRTAMVRARIEGLAGTLAPGSAVRVRVPVESGRKGVAIPVSALRKGPEGDHVFVVAPDAEGKNRATAREVDSGAMLEDEVLIHAGLAPGELVAASGSFKLRDALLVAIAEGTDAVGGAQ